MKKQMRHISYMQSLSYAELIEDIKSNVDESFFEPLMGRKYLQWIYYSRYFSDSEKKTIVEHLKVKMPSHAQELELDYCFIETFFPISSKIYEEICETINGHFANSMFIFSYCLSKYIEINPGTIGTAKELLMKIAMKVLGKELEVFGQQIILSDSVYYQYSPLIEDMYQKAILYGALQEKYDAISFGREQIVSISCLNSPPLLTMRLVDTEFERGLQYGCQYDNYLASRKGEIINPIYAHYKCKICSYCSLMGIPDDVKELAFNLLERQFLTMKSIDALFFYTGTLPSFVLSIISLIYTEIVKLVLFSDSSYIILSKNDIRKNMMWGNQILDSDFNDCYELVIKHEQSKGYFLPLSESNCLLIGKWMFDFDISVIENAKSVSLDAKISKRLGKSSNFFGKNVFEKFVRDRLKLYNWKVTQSSITLKRNKQIITDVDLLAYKDGIVVIGEVKVAHCERSAYQIWKASVTLRQAQEQAKITSDILKNDFTLLRAIFAKDNIKLQAQDIKHIIPVVITTSNYFTNLEKTPAIIGFDMLMELMNHAQGDGSSKLIFQSLTNPTSLFSFSKLSKIASVIETDRFHIIYADLE